MRICHIAVLTLFFAVVSFSQAIKKDATLSGSVFHAGGSVVVAGVQVTVSAKNGKTFKTKTDTSGKYSIDVEPGEVLVEFVSEGFKKSKYTGVHLVSSEKKNLDVTLEISQCYDCDGPAIAKERGPILGYCGTVRDNYGGSVPHVTVELKPEADSKKGIEYKIQTDADGNFNFEVVGGVYRITFNQSGFKKKVLKKQSLPNSRTCTDVELVSSVPPHPIT